MSLFFPMLIKKQKIMHFFMKMVGNRCKTKDLKIKFSVFQKNNNPKNRRKLLNIPQNIRIFVEIRPIA